MIPRVLARPLRGLARSYPVVTVTGPRQSGKTTLCRAAFPRKPYASLEAPDVRAFAAEDPRAFLAQYPAGAVLDEVQRVPDLLSYIQALVDARPGPGQFILTGSANFALLASVSQSLAGRTALLNLLPLGFEEVRRFGPVPHDLDEVLWRGSFPAVFDRALDPADWYSGYVGTYLERDVRTLLAVGDLMAFQTFLRLAAGRVGQLVNLSSLGADAGVTHNTARSWLSVLEASYVAWRLPPYHANVSKRLIRTPKLHFLDSGLVCFLLGIRSAGDLRHHPLRGPIFECWVMSEILKHRVHRGLQPALSFFQDRKGHEVDVLVDRGASTLAVEAKSGRTLASDFFQGLETFDTVSRTASPGRRLERRLVYGGAERQRRSGVDVVPWSAIDKVDW